MNHSLRPNQRIRGEKNFQLLFKKGKFERGPLLNLWVFSEKAAKTEKPKLGIIITRKVEPLAVKRNLLRRRIREIFRRSQERIKPGISVPIQVRSLQETPSFETIRLELDQLLARTRSLDETK